VDIDTISDGAIYGASICMEFIGAFSRFTLLGIELQVISNEDPPPDQDIVLFFIFTPGF